MGIEQLSIKTVRDARPPSRLFRALFHSPARVSIFGFGGLILLGMLFLMLPAATTVSPLRPVDALFTAVSAGCVTGLVVVDTGRALSTFGQVVVLMLIQVGGLGIMTISTLFLLIGRRRPSLVGRIVITDTLTGGGDQRIGAIVRDVVLFTFVIEGVGALLLFVRFLPGRTVPEALYFSVFHAVSAFCNAGFAFFADSFTGYRGDWVVNLVVCFLIVSGGIQITPPQKFVGKSLRELNLINRFGVQVVAVKEAVPDRLNMIPTADYMLKDSDLIILLGPNEACEKLKDLS